MFLTLMYHRIINSDPAASEKFSAHLTRLVENYSIVTPGDLLKKNQISICLTFDDSYFDFYHFVYPLLKKHNIKALLAVPTHYIVADTTLDANTRLNVPYSKTMENNTYQTHVPFCTWQEIKEMVASGHVIVGSHSCTHVDMTQPNADLKSEIVSSKNIIENQIQQPISTFIYPFGKMTPALNKIVKQHYTYAMRIGTSINLNWQNISGVIYRIDADKFWLNSSLWNKIDIVKYGLGFLKNSLRGR